MNYLYQITGKAFDRTMVEFYYSETQRTRKEIEHKIKVRLHCDTAFFESIVEYEIEISKKTEI